MCAQELGVALERTAPNLPLAAPRCPDGEPLLGPLRQRDLIRCDMLAGIAGADQSTKFLARVGQVAVRGLGEPLALDPIAQAPRIRPPRVNAAVAAVSSLTHCRSPSF